MIKKGEISVKRILINNLKAFCKGTIVACLLLLPLSGHCALVLEPETLDFGEIRYSDISEVTKKATIFNNTDQTKSVAILESSCACTTSPDFPPNLAPGEKKEFTVKLKPSSVGPFSNFLVVGDLSTTPILEKITMSIRGEIVPAAVMYTLPNTLELFTTISLSQKVATAYIEMNDPAINPADCKLMSRKGTILDSYETCLNYDAT